METEDCHSGKVTVDKSYFDVELLNLFSVIVEIGMTGF